MSLFGNYPEEWFGAGRPKGRREPAGARPEPPVAGRAAEEWIADRVAAELLRVPAVPGRDLGIMVQNRVVILVGDVDSAEVRRVAARRAWCVPGIFDVANCLTVRGCTAGFEDSAR